MSIIYVNSLKEAYNILDGKKYTLFPLNIDIYVDPTTEKPEQLDFDRKVFGEDKEHIFSSDCLAYMKDSEDWISVDSIKELNTNLKGIEKIVLLNPGCSETERTNPDATYIAKSLTKKQEAEIIAFFRPDIKNQLELQL